MPRTPAAGQGAVRARGRRRSAGRCRRCRWRRPRPSGAAGGVGTTYPSASCPAGTGNDFARATRLLARPPDEGVAALVSDVRAETCHARRRTSVDGGPAFGWCCLLGLMPPSTRERTRSSGSGGRARYPVAMIAELRRFRAIECTVTVDGVENHHRAMLIAIGNGASYGGGMRICPDAELTDGVLDVTVVDEISVPELLGSSLGSTPAATWSTRRRRPTGVAPSRSRSARPRRRRSSPMVSP